MIKRVAVIGSGAMGTGIGQVAASNGCDVVFFDAIPEMLAHSRQSFSFTMESLIVKNKITQDVADAILARCIWTDRLSDIAGADLVVEAIVEDIQIKKSMLRDIASHIGESCIVTSNTSSLSITALASVLRYPNRFAGLHFFNPAPVMKLVEVIPALQTDVEVVGTLRSLMEQWSKVAVTARDTPGFIVNRVARPYYGEALRIFDEGLAGCREIDEAMKEVGGFRMGPFELMDFIGHDVNYKVTESVYNAMFQDPRYKPSLTQRSLLDAGWLGRKSGKGFYNYPEQMEVMRISGSSLGKEQIFERIFAMLVNEAADAVYLRICTEEDVDKAMTLGTNYPYGLMQWGRTYGMDRITGIMRSLYETYLEDRYRLSPYLARL